MWGKELHAHVCSCLQSQEEGIRYPGAGVAGTCDMGA